MNNRQYQFCTKCKLILFLYCHFKVTLTLYNKFKLNLLYYLKNDFSNMRIEGRKNMEILKLENIIKEYINGKMELEEVQKRIIEKYKKG